MIEKGQVSVGGERVREPGRDVAEAAAVAFDPNRKALPKARSTLPVLHEDEHVLVRRQAGGAAERPLGARASTRTRSSRACRTTRAA